MTLILDRHTDRKQNIYSVKAGLKFKLSHAIMFFVARSTLKGDRKKEANGELD